MDTQKYQQMIRKMVHPNVTVQSLAMYAKGMAQRFPDSLCEFLEVSCENDIFKTAAVVHQSLGRSSRMARDFVRQILVEHCRSRVSFTHLDLLAIAVYKDHQLLLEASVFFTEQLLTEAFALTDVTTSCWLLRMSIMNLPESACALVRNAFCTSIPTNNSRMDSVLPELLTFLLEHNAADVLSVLINITGAKKIETLCGNDLFVKVDDMIRSGQDSIPLWEVYFDYFFSQHHTPEELLVEGLWHLEMYANETIINDVGAIFYLYAATHYGVEHPIFEHILDFSPPKEHKRRHTLCYMEMVDARWNQPEILSDFLKKTFICNPFYKEKVQKDGYTLFESARDPFSYSKLIRLFEAHASASAILTIFFCTDLRRNLPLEDVFYLAQRYEVLLDFLEAIKLTPFWGVITNQKPHALFVAPLSYFSSRVHVMNMSHQDANIADAVNNIRKGSEIEYTIIDFDNGFIKTEFYEKTRLTASKSAEAVSWEDAVAELESKLVLPNMPAVQLRNLAITKFSLDSFFAENDFSLLTQLILNHPKRLPLFLDTLASCEWNACFRSDSFILKGSIYDKLNHYHGLALQMFQTLFAFQKSIASILDLYFFSIYKVILPLNDLLQLADQNLLMEYLPNYTLYCRIPVEGSIICRPINIRSSEVCFVDHTTGIFSTEPFAATISSFTVRENTTSQIIMTPLILSEAGIKERGAMFGYLGKNIAISRRRSLIISTFPSVEQCTYREIVFNMSCMIAALNLRRSDKDAPRQLLQVLNNANPFAFQRSSFVDRIYFKDFSKRKKRRIQVIDTATIMALNAETIDDVRNLYLNTNIKYYMRLSEWAKLVCQRLQGLAEFLPTMLDDTVFYAIADSQGMLCMPWVEPNTIHVGKDYAGMFLHCHLKLNPNGMIQASVLQAYQSEEFYDMWHLCRLSGYRDTPEMEILVDRSAVREKLQSFTNPADSITESPVGDLPTFAEMTRLLRELLQDPKVSELSLHEQITRLINSYHTSVSQQEMEAAVAALTERWMMLLPSNKVFGSYLATICETILGHYDTTDLGPVITGQCQRYTNSKNVKLFETSLRKAFGRKAAAYKPKNSLTPFQEDIKKLWAKLSSPGDPHVDIPKECHELIRNYASSVTQTEMETEISKLTEKYLQEFPANSSDILLSLHEHYSSIYHSDSLGLILYQQALQYTNPQNADILEKLIWGTDTEQSNNHTALDTPPPEVVIPDFTQSLALLQEILRDPEESSSTIVNKINKLIRHHHTTVSLPEMQMAVAELTEELIREHADEELLKKNLLRLHECFIEHYHAVELSLILCLQAYEHMEFRSAMGLETKIRSSKTFRRYAKLELLLDYFMDRERIPPWKELYYTT